MYLVATTLPILEIYNIDTSGFSGAGAGAGAIAVFSSFPIVFMQAIVGVYFIVQKKKLIGKLEKSASKKKLFRSCYVD